MSIAPKPDGRDWLAETCRPVAEPPPEEAFPSGEGGPGAARDG